MSVTGTTRTTLLGALAALLASPAGAGSLTYPETRRGAEVDDYHGTPIADPYRWLEDTSAPETRAWIAAENQVTFAYLKALPGREELAARLTAVWDYERWTTPTVAGGRYFYARNDGLQNQSLLYWQTAPGGAERLLLDPNRLSADGTVAVTATSPSDDGKLLAYALSEAGSDWQSIRVRDVATTRDRDDVVRWVKFSGAEWTADGKGFFYGRYPEPRTSATTYLEANRNRRIHYHVLGQPQSEDRLVWERPDEPDWHAGISISDDGRFAVLSISKAGPRNRIHYIDLRPKRRTELGGPVVKLIDDFDASWTFLGNDRRRFYFKTDAGAPRGRVVAIDLDRPDPAHWVTVVPEAGDALQSVSLAGDRFLASYLHDAHTQVRVHDLAGRAVGAVDLPGVGSASGFAGRRQDREVFYAFQSYLEPATIYRYDVRRGASAVFRKPKVAFDPTPYETRQVFATSKDGTRVPVFVTARKGIALDRSHPTFLTGYGGFRIPMVPTFGVSPLPWLERGGVYAVANLRGGGEFGDAWHQAGTKARKQNVFDDFVAAAEHLIALGYTAPSRLAIAGGSNGGLLIGAVLNQRPDLFAAALPAVGVMDMLRYHKFTIGAAWAFDYGTSDDPELFPAIRAYSPLHNLRPGTRYPATLVTTGDHDDRVVPGHSFKYAAALQAAQGGDAPVLIRIETRAGHGAGKPTAMLIEETVDKWAFAMFHTGMTTSPAPAVPPPSPR